jgi:hypothetical protein
VNERAGDLFPINFNLPIVFSLNKDKLENCGPIRVNMGAAVLMRGRFRRRLLNTAYKFMNLLSDLVIMALTIVMWAPTLATPA